MAPAHSWLLISVSTAGAPASLRVQVWRKLRSLGAHYLQQSVCVLPDIAKVDREVTRLRLRVEHDGGSMRILHIDMPDRAETARLVGDFNSEREAEYAEILERIPDFMGELETELARNRATYAEVEESEADLARFEAWLAKIDARDYFGAPKGKAARAAVADAAEALARFEAEALRAETGDDASPPTDAARPSLSAVEDPEAG